MFTNILTDAAGSITAAGALECLLASLVFGLIIAALYMYRSQFTKSFVIGLVILPA